MRSMVDQSKWLFQSTLPVWGGTVYISGMTVGLLGFQSTLPVRGGT